jgi:hypothetical protein
LNYFFTTKLLYFLKLSCTVTVHVLFRIAVKGEKWIYKESDIYAINEKKVEEFDLEFEKVEKKRQGSQEVFYILSNSRISKNSI